MKIMDGNDSTVSLLPSSSTSSFKSRLVNWALRGSTKRRRINSKNSTPSRESKASNTPARSESSTSYSTPKDEDLQQRRISLPLERQYEWCLNDRYFRQESNRPDPPLFRIPNYNPEEDEPTSCEIVHVISNPVDPLDTTHAVYPGSESPVHRLSDGVQPLRKKVFVRLGSRDGNEHVSEIQDFDSHGRKKVRLVWGSKIDQIIPHRRRDGPASKIANTTCDGEDGAQKRKGWQCLSDKCQETKKLLKEQGKKIWRKMKSDRIPDDMDHSFPTRYDSSVDSIDDMRPRDWWTD